MLNSWVTRHYIVTDNEVVPEMKEFFSNICSPKAEHCYSVINAFQLCFDVKYIVRDGVEVCKIWMPCFCVSPKYRLIAIIII